MPKARAEIQALAREHSPKAFAKIIALIDDPNSKVAFCAAQEVLNRAWGKPAQAIEVTGEMRRYVIEIPTQNTSAIEWIQSFQPKGMEGQTLKQLSSGAPNPDPNKP